MFSVAIATVLFPALSRFAARRDYDGLRALMANGMRQIFLLLIPAAAATLALSEPITRLIYEHGRFGQSSTDLVSSALFWFSFSLPFSGVNLLLTRTFFSLQKPWITTGIAGLNLTGQRRGLGRAVQAVRHRGDRDRHRGLQRGDDARADVLPAPRAARPPRRPPHADRRRSRSRFAAALLAGAVVRNAGTCSTRRSGVGLLGAAALGRRRPGGRFRGLRARGATAAAYRRRAKSRASSGNGLVGAANGRKRPMNG